MKTKNKLLTAVLLLSTSVGFGQMNKFPNGVYLSLEQFKNQTPAFDADLQVIQRTSGDIALSGGNDYRLESDVDSISKKYIKKDIFAYVKNDSIFLNCFQHKLQTWYTLCLTSGNFLAFKASMDNSKAMTTALLGGAIASGLTANKRYLNVLSLRTGNVRELSKEYMVNRLQEKPELLAQYNNEQEQESETTLIKYINLLNEVTSPDSTPAINTSVKQRKRS